MKTLIKDYSFDASASAITLSAIPDIELERLLLVTNVATNTIIYNFADINKGGVAVTNVLALEYDTSSMADDDELQIYYDVDNFITLIDDTTTTDITYVGKGFLGSDKADPVWQIKILDETSGVEVLWADGDDHFDNIWDDRDELIYS